MKTAIVTGATGLIGNAVIQQLLNDTRYSNVLILVRKKLALDHPKLKQLVFDFDKPDASLIKGDELYCCLGTTIKTAGSKEVFFKVDHDYVVHTAKLAKQNGIDQLAVISAMAANSKSSVFYNKTKGEMEEAISDIGFKTSYIFRPSLLLGNRKEFRLAENLAKLIMVPLSFLIPKKYMAIKDTQVARAMIHFMNSQHTGNHIIENDAMLTL